MQPSLGRTTASSATGKSLAAPLLTVAISLLAGGASADEVVVKNRPPRFVGSEPRNYLRQSAHHHRIRPARAEGDAQRQRKHDGKTGADLTAISG